ncbi:bifunctional proline dehydrogenase/L-glutamate gamma-semialdehyde dehydrogenase PutA [Jeongeupia sp. USM3]|uniref:bifunctional proline dehydrogenase/L-glutamate gamma-semialdehyde dehydrogenase PutA n=1 Tax=Jeongeupia sp. USM3 TaxID=1906741 RepID=UPI00089DE20C|nr:bifunctional proline dehydrogenase/L-glutamate gamma-semialdehyde dehydrogenase PutA [Jeongeupia sp. USM3]AOX99641.1 hypothetical protein BJP62_03720 [Jeongeupia sp. USM3]
MPPFDSAMTPSEALARLHFADETQLVRRLLPLARLSTDEDTLLQRYAPLITEQLRVQRRSGGGIDALLAGFPLDSDAGRVLLTLAEALPRIPDTATADRLIAELLHDADWRRPIQSQSAWLRLARWTLGHARHWSESDTTEPLVRFGLRAALRELGRHVVIAEDIDTALARRRAGFDYSFDMLGEAAQTQADAERYEAAYRQALLAVGASAHGAGISIKLSALHPRYEPRQAGHVHEELWPRLLGLTQLARQLDIPITIDAEESDRMALTLSLFERLLATPVLADWDGLGIAVQAYQKRALAQVDWLVERARAYDRRIAVRLVKGAYWDGEIKQAQVEGWPDYPVFTRKSHTDVCYLACARRLFEAAETVWPQFATHNAYTALAIHAIADGRDFEYQCLYGMGEAFYTLLPGHGLHHRCRVYAPVGEHALLLPYLVRRMLENGANTAFVHQLLAGDEPAPATSDPLADALAHPGPALPPPTARVDGLAHAPGVCWADRDAVQSLQTRLAAPVDDTFTAAPTHQAPSATRSGRPIFNPARPDTVLGHAVDAGEADVDLALRRALAIAPVWAQTPVAERADWLDRIAGCLTAQRDPLLQRLVAEAGKTLPDALGEWREAVDLCRYYAATARHDWAGHAPVPLGPVAAISPWHFPLAIFVGQIAAALVAGNPVIAKPAEETPLIAAFVVDLCHAAGLDRDVLQLLPGNGRVGALLAADPRVAGVLFTGSLETARAIHRNLARHETLRPLVAETGGINALIADTSAQPEQLIRDVLAGAFNSAGQRRSALRLLCLPEATGPALLARLRAAMAELRLGDPATLATDLGPLISAAATGHVHAATAALHRAGYPAYQTGRLEQVASTAFAAPTLIEIDRPDALPGEIFGPVLAVLQYGPAALPALLGNLDALDAGLTLAVHSRSPGFVDTVLGQVQAGNVYVNRHQIGAVVGSQPFGGQRRSGTGPKAGGPWLTWRLTQGGDPCRTGVIDAGTLVLAERLRELARGCAADEAAALIALIDDCAARSPVGRTRALPGPTGERNTLGYRPRGLIACHARTVAARRQQLVAVVLTGNTAVLAESAELLAWRAALGERCRLVADPLALPIAACLCAAQPTVAFKQHLAERSGAIVDVVMPTASGRYPLYRLVSEQAVSVNTTATGGNADLLAAAE